MGKVIYESDIQSKILKDLRSYGKDCFCFKIEKASENGVPDIYFSMKEFGPILLETKRPTGKTSKIQDYQIKKIRLCGAIVFVCYSWNQWISIKSILHLL